MINLTQEQIHELLENPSVSSDIKDVLKDLTFLEIELSTEAYKTVLEMYDEWFFENSETTFDCLHFLAHKVSVARYLINDLIGYLEEAINEPYHFNINPNETKSLELLKKELESAL